MIIVEFALSDGSTQKVFAREGMTLMEAAVQSGVPGIAGECGGSCACATCHVVVTCEWQDRLGRAGLVEDQLLDMVDRQAGSRLACQIKIKAAFDGMTLAIPPKHP